MKLEITESGFIKLVGTIVAVAILVLLTFTAPVNAAVFVYGTNYNYSEVVLPNASYVHQGENISQGYYYDMFGVYGFSGKVAHWKNVDDIGYEIPDTIVTLDDRPHHLMYIDPEKFPVGEWYQWDGVTCQDDTGWCKSGFGHGNSYVFAVVKKAQEYKTVDKSITVYKNITVTGEDGNEMTVQVTVQETIKVQEPVLDVLVTNVTTLVVPTTAPILTAFPTPQQTLLLPNSDHTPVPTTLQVVTPKSAQTVVPIFVLIALAFVVMYGRE